MSREHTNYLDDADCIRLGSGMEAVAFLPDLGPAWRRNVKEQERLRITQQLAALLDAGYTIVLNGRSSSGGRRGREAAANDLHNTAHLLFITTGIDLRSALPSREALIEQLANAQSQQYTSATGLRRYMRVATGDRVASHGFAYILGTVSGRDLDEKFDQPYAEEAGRFIKKMNAAFFAIKRYDRASRSAWAAGKYFEPLKHVGGSLLCTEGGVLECNDITAFLVFFNSAAAERQAALMPQQLRRDQTSRSGTRMVNGQVPYHGAAPLPYGFGVCWIRKDGIPTDRIAYLDMPGCRPDSRRVSHGLSEVLDDDDNVVDQVANVRFVLDHVGQPGWTIKRIADEMVTRRLSAPSLRSWHRSPSASVSTDGSNTQFIDSILQNLSFYETGILERGLGADEHIKIVDCFPPDGPWAAPEKFATIRSWREAELDRSNRAARLGFAGVTGTLAGQPVVLRTRSASSRRASHPTWTTRYVLRRPSTDVVVSHRTYLDPSTFAESLIVAIARLDDQILRTALPVLGEGASSAELTELQQRLRTTTTDLEDRQHACEAMLRQLAEVDADGSPVITGALAARLNQNFNAASADVERLTTQCKTIEAQIAQFKTRRPGFAEATEILHLIASLRDIYDTTYRPLWKRSIQALRFDVIDNPDGSKAITWTGSLNLTVDSEDGTSLLVPFSGSHPLDRPKPGPAPGQSIHDPDGWIDNSLHGRPVAVLIPTVVREALAVRWGIATTHPIFNVRDLRLRQLMVALAEYPDHSDADLSVRLREPTALVGRIRSLYFADAKPSCWLTRGSHAQVAAHLLASTNAGSVTVDKIMALATMKRGAVHTAMAQIVKVSTRWTSRRKKGYRFECECGSHAAAPMRLREVVGAVCLACRTDEAGVVWPADPYDRYRSRPELWPGPADPDVTDDEEKTA